MVFNDTTTKLGIIQNCESLCRLGDTGITGNAIVFAKFVSYINQAIEKIAMAILQVDKNWRWDDSASHGNAAVATADLVTGQRDYVLPKATVSSDTSTLWKIYKVRIKDTNGSWYELIPLASDENENNSNATGAPTRYRLLGNTIRLSDIPLTGSVTFEEGLQVWYQRSFVLFTASDTTKQPPFMSSFHYLVEFDASASYLYPLDTKLALQYDAKFRAGLEEMKNAYGLRNDDPNVTKRLNPYVEDTR